MMGIKEISEYLPHRYPFLLVDRVVSVEPGDRLDIESRIIGDKRHVMKFGCSAYVDGELACSAEIICVEKTI